MKSSLRHRGPNSEGLFTGEKIGLVHTRLSIVDLSSAGHQPMSDASGRYILSYNGEVYNAPDLRRQLSGRGYSFRSSSDTEVVLNALVEWGTDALKMFNGMFALAFWDKSEQSLTLARDRFGIKPLFFVENDKGLFFSSEIKGLLAADCVARKLSRQGLVEYLLYGVALGGETLYDGCKQLLPGHWLTTDRNGVQNCQAFWSLNDIVPVHDKEDAAINRVTGLLKDAVGRHLMADVPVGIFLSGGLDSSTLCALAASHSPGDLSAYSVEFEGESAHSEIALAREVARKAGVSHQVISLGFGNLEANLDSIVSAYDQPFGDAASLPLLLLSQSLASEKVVLQGDGGDEIFAGYRRYQLLQNVRAWKIMKSMLPAPKWLIRRSVAAQRFNRMLNALGHSDGWKRNAWLLTEETEADNPYHYFKTDVQEVLQNFDAIDRYERLWEQTSHHSPAQSMLYTDSQIILPDVFLQKVDRVTMSSGIEVRVPFLDTELTDYVMGLPARMKCGTPSKHLLRKAMKDHLPESVLSGQKYGFGVPYSEWLRGPLLALVKRRLLDPDGFIATIFDTQKLRQVCDDHAAQRQNKGFLLYKLLILSIWAERYDIEPLECR